MSLMKRRLMSEARKAASRANGRHSRGPATPQGRERMRAANLRHGLFSEAEQVVLTSLGEDPDEFEKLRQGLYASFPLADASQEPLVESLAAATWRLERINRRQEDLAIQQARELFAGGGRADSQGAFDPAAALRALRLEECAFREFLRIGNRLMNAQPAKGNPALPGQPQNMLKRKEE